MSIHVPLDFDRTPDPVLSTVTLVFEAARLRALLEEDELRLNDLLTRVYSGEDLTDFEQEEVDQLTEGVGSMLRCSEEDRAALEELTRIREELEPYVWAEKTLVRDDMLEAERATRLVNLGATTLVRYRDMAEALEVYKAEHCVSVEFLGHTYWMEKGAGR